MGFFNNIYDDDTKLHVYVKAAITKYTAMHAQYGDQVSLYLYVIDSPIYESYLRKSLNDLDLRRHYKRFQYIYWQEILPCGSVPKSDIEGKYGINSPVSWTTVDIYRLFHMTMPDGKESLRVEEAIIQYPCRTEAMLVSLLGIFLRFKIGICRHEEGGRKIWL